MNDKIILIIFLSIWSIFYFVSLLMIDINYIRVNKVSIKQINKISNNINTYEKNLLIIFEAKLDFNKTCQIDIINSKMINNIIHNIENNNYKYFTIIKTNNLCEKPETFDTIVLDKILFYSLLLFISLLFTFLLINLIFNKNNGYKFYELKNNYKKDDNNDNYDNNDYNNDVNNNNNSIINIIPKNYINLKTDLIDYVKIDIQTIIQNDNNSINIKYNNEFNDYDIIETNEIKKINSLEYV